MKTLAILTAWGILLHVEAVAADWIGFRGPGGSGVAETGEFPSRVDPETNLVWKVAVPQGKSSPVIVGDRILFTGHEGDQRFVLCYDTASGNEIWRQTLQVERAEHRHKLNDPASPSVASDGERIFAFFADFGLTSYSLDGEEVWKLPLGPFDSQHGLSVSPVQAAGKLFLLVDHMGGSYLAAFDPQNGETLWRTPREDYIGSYSTPAVYGKEIITVGPGEVISYSTESGKRLWYFKGLPFQSKSLPVIGEGMVFVNAKGAGQDGSSESAANFTTYLGMLDKNQNQLIDVAEAPNRAVARFIETSDKDGDSALSKQEWDGEFAADRKAGALRAIRLGGTGDVTDTHLAWRYDRSMANVPSPLLYHNVIYSLRNGGILTALNAQTGQVLKQGRLRDAIDGYYASPVAGDGKIYALSETGQLTVIRAGESWEVLDTVDLGEAGYASPALSEGSVFVRTSEALYRFGGG